MKTVSISLKVSLILTGIIAAGIGCYGAFEAASRINGGYLVIAAPVVALAAALIPYFAEKTWEARHYLKAFIWILVLLPAAATVFFAAAERVHDAKAGAEAERAAYRSAIARAETALTDAKAKTIKAEADAKTMRAKSRKVCDTACIAQWDAEATAARTREAAARTAITSAQAKAADEAEIKMPVWLLPTALDSLAFIALWTGLALPVPGSTKRPARKMNRKPVQNRRQALGRKLQAPIPAQALSLVK